MKKFHVGIKGAIIKNDKLLLLQKNGGERWQLPGGRIDDNETIPQTLTRELNEELPNIKNITIGNIIYALRRPKDIERDLSLTLIYYRVSADFDGEPQFSHEHTGWMWADREQATELMIEDKGVVDAIFSQ